MRDKLQKNLKLFPRPLDGLLSGLLHLITDIISLLCHEGRQNVRLHFDLVKLSLVHRALLEDRRQPAFDVSSIVFLQKQLSLTLRSPSKCTPQSFQ